jgi:pullulanase/glycogen debranching enzyme
MHSRIYQISTEPIKDFITEDRYDEWGHADYTVEVQYESDDYMTDLKWLQNATEGLSINLKEKTITITSKEEYFTRKFDKFKELLEELQDINLKEFTESAKTLKVFDLVDSYEDKYAFYIDDDEYCGLTNLDNWVRNAEENKTYYIGSIFDYHY